MPWIALLVALLTGCGGARMSSADAAYAPAQTVPAEEVMGMPAPPAPGGGSGYAEAERSVSKAAYADSGSLADMMSSPAPAPPPGPAAGPQTPEGAASGAPLVVYSGYLKLRVKRLLGAVDDIERLVKDKGGYVESLTERVIVVRIPAKDFEAVMAAFAEVGQELDRRVQAVDVTAQFTDLAARLAVAKEARERLLKLLEKVVDVSERLRILEEVKRLTEQIESVTSTLRTLANLIDFFTITIELEPVMESYAAEVHRSPFTWVRALVAHLTTIADGKNDVAMTLPPDFVLFDKDDTYRAQAADTAILRAGVIDNEPRGDNAFWAAAVDFEMEGRDEEIADKGEAGKVTYRVYASRDPEPRYYLVGVRAAEEDLFVVEVFFPNAASYEAHRAAVIEALETFEVK